MAQETDNQTIRPEDYYNTVHVEDYYDKVHRTTWTRRLSSMLAGSTYGAILGGAIGTVAAYLPHLLLSSHIIAESAFVTAEAASVAAALPTFGAVIASAALFAGVAAFFGITIFTSVASSAASVAADLEEMEKRGKVVKAIENGASPSVGDGTRQEAKKEKMPKLYSWKVAACTIPLAAAFGALIAFSPVTASAVALLGFKAASAGAVISSAAIFGMFGGIMGLKNSYITNKIHNFYFKLVTEQYFTKGPENEPVPQPSSEKTEAPAQDYAIAESIVRSASFTDGKQRFALADIINRKDGEVERQTVITR